MVRALPRAKDRLGTLAAESVEKLSGAQSFLYYQLRRPLIGLRDVIHLIVFLRVPTLCVLILILILFPAQARELVVSYRLPVTDWPLFLSAYTAMLLFNLLLVLYSFELWHSYRRLYPESRVGALRVPWFVGVPIAVLLPGAVLYMIGWHLAAVDSSTSQSWHIPERWVIIGFSIIVFVLGLFYYLLQQLISLRQRNEHIDAGLRYAILILFPMSWLGTYLLIRASIIEPKPGIQPHDSLFLIISFLSCAVAIASVVTIVGDRFRIPALATVVLLGAVLSFFDLNDHHYIRNRSEPAAFGEELSGVSTVAQPKELGSAFVEWLARRPDIEHYASSGHRYPVFIVAAQGGGSYAAYHTALFLARIQDREPEFAEHIFAVSGVSGGSLGSAVFVAAARLVEETSADQIRDHRCRVPRSGYVEAHPTAGPVERLVHCFFRHDLLSPVVGALLFNDLPFFFVPTAFWGRHTDRGVILEQSIEHAWANEISGYDPSGKIGNFFGQSSVGYWRPTDRFPALVTNTTIVERGAAMVLGPLFWGDMAHNPTGIHHVQFAAPGLDVSVSSAVSLSARFPWLLPAGSIKISDEYGGRTGLKEILRLVDGGYVENFGVATIMSMLDELHGLVADGIAVPLADKSTGTVRVDFIIPMLSNKYGDYFEGRWLSDSFAPLRTMLNVRAERGLQYERLAYKMKEKTRAMPVYLGDEIFQPPLGLTLAETTLKQIELRSGFVELPIDFEKIGQRNVPVSLSDKDKQTVTQTVIANNAVAQNIVSFIRLGRR